MRRSDYKFSLVIKLFVSLPLTWGQRSVDLCAVSGYAAQRLCIRFKVMVFELT